MRILHIISSTNPLGGGPIEGIKQLSRAMCELGVKVEVVSCDAPDAPWLASSGLNIHAVGPGLLKYGYARRLVPWLREHAGRYDAVIVNGIWQYHALAAWRVLSQSDTPYFVFTHGMLDPWFKRQYPLKHLKKWFYWPWGDYRVLRDARAVIFTCEEERLLARQSFWLYRVNEVVASYGTASPPPGDVTPFLNEWSELQNRRVILFLSRIHEKKGCDLLLEAFARVAAEDDSLHLVMAGPAELRLLTALKTEARRLKIESRITWAGMLEGDAKWAAFRLAEVLCLPSHQENFGIVVAEALACGTPVLISNKVNIWREIESDRAGFVGDDSVDGTERSLRRWMGLDQGERAEMGARALHCFESRFQAHRAGERLIEIIRENTQ